MGEGHPVHSEGRVAVISIGIVGATGYTGVELLRLLANHPEAEVRAITSRSAEGTAVADLYPNLRGRYDLRFVAPDVEPLSDCDVVFFATPHNVAMGMVPELLARGVRIIDLSADFRLRDAELWQRWYGEPHACPELLTETVYGLPELNRAAMAEARLIACAGCYPTAVQLGFMPLLAHGLVDADRLIASAASGASGAGRQARVDNLLSETAGSFKAYGASGHRHLPEIRQILGEVAGGPVSLTFVLHLLPIVRRIHSTLYSELVDADQELATLQQYFVDYYRDEPFVDLLPPGSHPQTRSVTGSNLCRIALHRPADSGVLVVLAVIDNLTKGASGQAVQCMNIALGLPETMGLEPLALMP